MKTTIVLLFLLVLPCTIIYAQEDETKSVFDEETEIKHHQIGFMLGHAHISQGHSNGNKKWLALPMISLNYNYWFNERWAFGLHTDMVLEDFEVEQWNGSGEDKILERKTPIAPAIMMLYKPGKHFTYMLGIGEEFTCEENLFLIRAEVEYSLELPNEFEFGTSVGYDIRVNEYDSWALQIGVSKLF
ncbi:hypothetical protein [Formosa sp. S-31]|uniref:hypothetical protein n=1 Tax=Formosa sp. S-31 TaxID=2790949 RepID=UPI003EBCC76B